MSEKEIKKINESSEKEVSGGSKTDKKAWLDDIKKNPGIFAAATYGGPLLTSFPFHHGKPLAKPKKPEGNENPQTALATSQPQTEDKK